MKYLVLCTLMLTACPSGAALCQHLETRCAEDVSQLCDARGRWEVVADCASVEGDHPFTCRQDEDGDHVCLPGI